MGDTAEGSWTSNELLGFIRREEARKEASMSTQHSPGPWKLYEPWANGTFSQDAKHRLLVIHDSRLPKSELMADGKTRSPQGYAICDAKGSPELPWEEQVANAYLIASAPDLLAERDRLRESNKELLEACKLAMAELRYYPGDTDKVGDAKIDVAFNACESAIARAQEQKPSEL